MNELVRREKKEFVQVKTRDCKQQTDLGNMSRREM